MSGSEVEGFESSLNCADWHVHCDQICFPFCSNFGYVRFVFVNIFITAFSILVRIDYEQSAVILTIQSSSCVEPAFNQPSDRLVSTHSPGGCTNGLLSTCSRSAYEKGVVSVRSPGGCANGLVSTRSHGAYQKGLVSTCSSSAYEKEGGLLTHGPLAAAHTGSCPCVFYGSCQKGLVSASPPGSPHPTPQKGQHS